MKYKIIYLVILSIYLISNNTFAQLPQVSIKAHLANEAVKNNWPITDIKEWRISDLYSDKESKLTHVYIQQVYSNIVVYNAISVFAMQEGKVSYYKPGHVEQIQSKVNAIEPNLTERQALDAALSHLKLSLTQSLPRIKSEPLANTYWYEAPEIASSPIKIQLVLKPIDDKVLLAWDVSIEMKNDSHWWNIRVDALNGQFLDKNDYTVECYAENEHHLMSDQETEESPVPSPPTTFATPYYNVFPYPIEAPSFGSRSLLNDPSVAAASPYGWHDVDGITGADYTITRGNNVFAYEDINADNLPGYSPDGGSLLDFNYPFTNGALPLSNQDASLTNLFYTCNRIHDYLYQSGFTETSGNFQFNNYANGGIGNDYVKAEAMDGSGTNNANFSTSPDGNAGRMQMFLWTGNSVPCSQLTIGSVTYNGPMLFGTSSFSATANVTASLVLVDDGVGLTTDACSPIVNNITGKIALIDRGGTCTFLLKAQAALTAGAVGVIIANNASGVAPFMSGSPALTIPVLSVSQTDGNILKSALLSGQVTVSMTTCNVNQIDCAFDNGVIAHEYGHGLSNRLTGGPSQTSCLSNAEQGGEGWSDWLALMMTIEPNDSGGMARGMGTYSKGQATNGPGIRRFLYSTNMAINPQTYSSLASSTTVHQIGEIWCDVIWDMSWLLMNTYGFNANPSIASAGNNIAMRLVLEGMRLQPCSPGFIDARDAILMADALLYANAHRCLIWQAFARRGMGFNASQGSANLVGDEVESFLLPPFCLPPTQVPTAAFVSNTSTISCGGNIQFNDQSVQAFNWLWNFGDGSTSILQHPNHTYTSPGAFTVKLIVSNPLGIDSVVQNIIVSPTFVTTTNASPTILCGGDSVLLNASANGSTFASYQTNPIPYAPISGSGTAVTLADDAMSTAKPIGFTFNFFGQAYTQFYMCSNGFITFSPGMPFSVVYGEQMPSVATPNNMIALAWNDLNPQNAGSFINYFTTGTAPNRKLVINYSTSHYLSTAQPFIVQAILFEGSNQIEIHTTSISDVSSFDTDAKTTQGIENFNGTHAVIVPGRNANSFSASNDAYRFTPYTPYQYQWMPGNLSGAGQVVFPLSPTTYSLTVTDGYGCSVNSITSNIQVVPCTINIQLKAFIQGYYLGAGLMQPVLFNQGVNGNQSICDSIQIELHQSLPPYNVVASAKTLLQTNGLANVSFNSLAGPYYLVVKHRNVNETWSASPITFTGNPTIYNFSLAPTQAYGQQMTNVDTNIWALYNGDVNQDDNIDLGDFQQLDAGITQFNFGYQVADINGDGNVDLGDIPFLEQNINQFIYSIQP